MLHRRGLRLLAVVLGLSLLAAACGGDDDDAVSEGEVATEQSDVRVGLVYDLGGRGDQSFNDAAYAGLSKAEDELGVEIQDLEPTGSGEDREVLLRTLAEDGFDLIIGVGPSFADSLAAVATDFPETSFGIVDGLVDLPNVASLVFAEEQGAYLVGAAAGLTTKTGKVGFLGGQDTELARRFEAGYVAGVQKVKPDATVDVQYLPDPADPVKLKEIALGQYGGGADVVFHAPAGSGTGLFEAAGERRAAGSEVWSIGVDSDQALSPLIDEGAKATILTSMLKRVDVAVFDTVKAMVEGRFRAGPSALDVAHDGVGYATTGDHLSVEVRAQLDDLVQRIVDGQIEIPTAPG